MIQIEEQLAAMKEMGEELKKAKSAAKEAEMQVSQMRHRETENMGMC